MRTKSYRYTHNQWSESFDPTLDSESTLVLVLFECSLDIDNQLQKIKAAFPKSKIIGTSTSGEIQNAELIDNSIVCMIIQFEHTRLKTVSTPINYETSTQAGIILGDALASPDLKHILLFAEGLDVDASDLVHSLDRTLKNHKVDAPISGGMAADSHHFIKTFIIDDTSIKNRYAVAVGFYGEDVKVFSGIGTGWSPFGPIRLITKASRNTIFEIDGIPALKLYKEYIKEDAKNLPITGTFFPLGIENETIVRSVARIDEAENALILAHKIPENTRVQLMHSNVMKLIDGAEGALDGCTLDFSGDLSTAALIVSCVGRRLMMGQKTEDEIDIIKARLPKQAEICGFYSYGEFSPTANKKNELHNQTMTLIIFQERA